MYMQAPFATVRWTARTIGIAILGLVAAFAIGEGVPNPLTLSIPENILPWHC
jgi:hypothetical protein